MAVSEFDRADGTTDQSLAAKPSHAKVSAAIKAPYAPVDYQKNKID
jgi:hypothetical protein